MYRPLRTVLRSFTAPRIDCVTGDSLGFPAADPEVRRRLDAIPQAVVCGYEWGLEARDLSEIESRINLLDEAVRGFGYEGATMALTILDATSGGTRTAVLLDGPGRPHLFLAYIGIGFAMSHLPRRLWHRVLPDIDAAPYHPALSWLAVDGYGFDLAYFKYHRWAVPSQRPAPWPWLGQPSYFQRASDQGLGRALWFVHGARPGRVDAAISAFPAARHADLWSGVGLAATFAGPSSDDARQLLTLAGRYADHLGMGAVLAARARDSAELVPSHTRETLAVLTGLEVRQASLVADLSVETVDLPEAPAYELWRTNIRSRLGSFHADGVDAAGVRRTA